MAAFRPSVAVACLALVACLCGDAAAQQQGSIQVSSESQLLAGNAARRGAEHLVDPDFGVFWTQPGTAFGQFQLELRATRRGEAIHAGRSWLSLRDAKFGGMSWTLQGGALYAPTDFGEYQFSNLATPYLTFTGALATAKTKHATVQVLGGRSNALRNIFGSDPQQVDQGFGLLRAAYDTQRLHVNARGARTRTGSLREFTRTASSSVQAGGGARFLVTPSLHLVGDASYVQYRPAGTRERVGDYSYLAGTHWLLPRGWVQANASRYSPGDFPVLNSALRDRSGAFVSGEYDLFTLLRLFGGWERVETNLRPLGDLQFQPQTTTDRGFGGVRFQVASRSTASLRLEDGGRVARPVLPGTGLNGAFPQTSDTGSYSAEWQTATRHLTAFGRYAHRENVDTTGGSFRLSQNDTSGQIFLNLSPRTQLFGNATLTHQKTVDGNGSTFVQIGGGGQQRVFSPGLYLRVEGSAMRNRDLLTGTLVPRNAWNVGLNGQITRQTTIGLNMYLDRAPALDRTDGAWLARSTLRIVHTISTRAVRVPNTTVGSNAARISRGTGSVIGSVFADWNANGEPDAGEETLAGIPIKLEGTSQLTTARDGQFAFLNVPAGAQQVLLDLNALPVDFDPPAVPMLTIELSRGDTRRIIFGLVPLGIVRGRVFEDVNKNGQIDPGDPPLEAGVLSLDNGQRSEIARKGVFRFDAVRAGAHRLALLPESLPEGALIVGDTERPAAIAKDQPDVTVNFLVRVEKRPEVRKVFPPKIGTGAAAPRPSAPAAAPHLAAATPASPASTPATRPATPRAGIATVADAASRSSGTLTIQVAALADVTNARALVARLRDAGYDAYIVAPIDGDNLYRVRVGHYASRVRANQVVARLERQLGVKLWVTGG